MTPVMHNFRAAGAARLGLGLALAVCLAVGAACGRRGGPDSAASEEKPAPPDASPQKNEVILQVGSSFYFRADFDAVLKRILGDDPDQPTPETLSRLFDRFVDDKLLLEAAERQGISLTEEEKSRYQEKTREERNPAQSRTPTAAETNSLNDRLLIDKYSFILVKDISVTSEEIHAYYIAHKSDFLKPERFKVSQILLKTEEQAIDVLARVQALSEDGFRSVARKESMGPEAAKAGEMGVFSPGQLPYEIEKVVSALAEGQTSQIVQSSYGFHIFRLDKRIGPELVTEDQAAPSIQTKLLDDKISRAVAAHLAELRRTMDWTASTQNLSFVYQRNTP